MPYNLQTCPSVCVGDWFQDIPRMRQCLIQTERACLLPTRTFLSTLSHHTLACNSQHHGNAKWLARLHYEGPRDNSNMSAHVQHRHKFLLSKYFSFLWLPECVAAEVTYAESWLCMTAHSQASNKDGAIGRRRRSSWLPKGIESVE